MPQIRILDTVDTVEELNPAEIRWIAHGREQGWPLTNLTTGGDGRQHTNEERQALSVRMQGNQYARGVVQSEERRQATRERMLGKQYGLGYRPNAEYRARVAERMRGNSYAAGRVVPPDELAKRTASIQATYDAWTPEQHAEHARKISEAKQGSPGNIENLRLGWTAENRAKAVIASADARRGTHETAEHRAKISAGLKAAYASGARARGHSDETRAKIAASKTGKSILGTHWSLLHEKCAACGETARKHKGRGLCTRCFCQKPR